MWLLLVMLAWGNRARGEYPALESAFHKAAAEVAAGAGPEPLLVAARNIGDLTEDWRVTAAVQTSLTALLRQNGVDAHDCAAELQYDWMVGKHDRFLPRDVTRCRRIGRFGQVLFCELLPTRGSVNVDLDMWSVADEEREVQTSLELPPATFQLNVNVPEVNRKVVQYVQSQYGRQCGDGECSTLAIVALREAQARRDGLYIFGRVLADREALLPGDVLQFERARFQAANGGRRRRMRHHTAVIEEVQGADVVQCLNQNFGSGAAKKTVRRLVLHLNELREGRIVAFRPTTGDSILPDVKPRRRGAVELRRTADGGINLLTTIDPHLDSIRGLWQDFEGPLLVPREPRAQLQIPVDPGSTYTLRGRIERLHSTGLFGLGLVIGGRTSLLVLQDSFVGLDSLDGKRANGNASSVKLVPLPLNEEVAFECRVVGNRVELDLNGTQVLAWQGDVSRLKPNPSWTPPRPEWLLLAGHQSRFAIHELTLETEAVASD